jgi:hypothetical protein
MERGDSTHHLYKEGRTLMRIVSSLLAGGALVAALSGCVAYPAPGGYYAAPVAAAPVAAPVPYAYAPGYAYAPSYYGPGYYGYYGPSVYIGGYGGGYWGRGGGWHGGGHR